MQATVGFASQVRAWPVIAGMNLDWMADSSSWRSVDNPCPDTIILVHSNTSFVDVLWLGQYVPFSKNAHRGDLSHWVCPTTFWFFYKLEAACLAMPSSLCINGRLPIVYIAIASRSPRVVPSSDSKHWPPTKRHECNPPQNKQSAVRAWIHCIWIPMYSIYWTTKDSCVEDGSTPLG